MVEYEKLNAEIHKILSTGGYSFESNIAAGGIESDFLVKAPNGRLITLEAKACSRQPGIADRLANQARLWEEELGADRALFVVDQARVAGLQPSIVDIDQLEAALKTEMEVEIKAKNKLHVGSSERRIFVAMPFASRYDDVYYVAMASASKVISAALVRMDKEEYSGEMISAVRDRIEKSAAVIIDLSESNANVLYEAGYAHALRKPCVHICSTPLDELPFDVSTWNTIKYEAGQTYHLREPLTKRLECLF